MVGAATVRLAQNLPGNTGSSNNSTSNSSSLDDYKVMVAASVTVLSGVIQVSTFSCNLPTSICLPWLVHISLFFLATATPPRIPFSLCLSLVAHKKYCKKGHSSQPEGEEWVNSIKMNEYGSRQKEEGEWRGTNSDKWNASTYIWELIDSRNSISGIDRVKKQPYARNRHTGGFRIFFFKSSATII